MSTAGWLPPSTWHGARSTTPQSRRSWSKARRHCSTGRALGRRSDPTRSSDTFADKARLVEMLNKCLTGDGVRVVLGSDSDLTSGWISAWSPTS